MHGLIHVIIFQEHEATEEATAAEEEAQGDEGEQLSGEEPAEEEGADDSEPKIDPDTGEPMPKKKKPSSSPDSNYINPSTYISEQRKAESDMDKFKSDIVEKKKSLDVWLTWVQTLPAADQSFFDAEKALALTRRQAISHVLATHEAAPRELRNFIGEFEQAAKGAGKASSTGSNAPSAARINKAPPCKDYAALKCLRDVNSAAAGWADCDTKDELKQYKKDLATLQSPIRQLLTAAKSSDNDFAKRKATFDAPKPSADGPKARAKVVTKVTIPLLDLECSALCAIPRLAAGALLPGAGGHELQDVSLSEPLLMTSCQGVMSTVPEYGQNCDKFAEKIKNKFEVAKEAGRVNSSLPPACEAALSEAWWKRFDVLDRLVPIGRNQSEMILDGWISIGSDLNVEQL